MKKDDVLNYLEMYKTSLEYIDKKIPLLMHSDEEKIKQEKQLKKLKNKFKGVNLIILWVVFTLVGLIPMSLLNMAIETTFNIIILTPVVAFIVLYLYKTKNSKGNHKTQINITEASLKKINNDNLQLIGEINYTKTVADEVLARLLLSKEDCDIINCEEIYTNKIALEYIYGYILTDNTTSFKKGIEHYQKLLEEMKKNPEAKELYDEYIHENLISEYRIGALKRCAKATVNPPN